MPLTLTRENYHSQDMDKEYMSAHQFNNWMTCPAKEAARQSGKYVQPNIEALLVGQYVHMAVLTPDGMPAWMEKNGAEVVSQKTKKKYAPYEVADRMIERVRGNQDAMALLNGEPERVIIFELGEYRWKAALDVADFSADTPSFADLKTAKDFEDFYDAGSKTRVPWYEYIWRQMAIYRHAFKSVTLAEPCIYVVGVTKQEPADLCLRVFDNVERMNAEIDYILHHLPHVMAMKTGAEPATPCGKNSCDYCRANKAVTLEVAESMTWPSISR